MVTHSSTEAQREAGSTVCPLLAQLFIHTHCFHSLFVAHSCFVASTTAHLWRFLREDNKKRRRNRRKCIYFWKCWLV